MAVTDGGDHMILPASLSKEKAPVLRPPASVDLHSGVWTTEKVANFKGRVMPPG